MLINPSQSRAARGLLEWSQQQLAEAASVGLSTIRGFENGSRQPIANNLSAIRAALESAGVQFVSQGDEAGGDGVVLRKR
jgi:transcriptional regulator with XRE-family HTH domain